MRTPVSTYRLQLRQGVDLRRAAELLPYLDALGVSDLYLSPILVAEPTSTHGYDVVAHDRVDPALGGEEALAELAAAARARGIGVVVDFVPNHVSVASDRNAEWQDLLTYGRASPMASTFDVEWSPPRAGLEGRILLPILGDTYGRVLERGELRLARSGGHVRLRYWERDLPIAPATLAPLVERAAAEIDPRDPRRDALAQIARALGELPPPQATPVADAAAVSRARDLERALAEHVLADPEVVGRAIDAAIAAWNGAPGDPASFDALHALISRQAYRPSAWRLALESINYRRFFDVDHLAAIRMELPEVFERAHRALFAAIARGEVTGVRLDHVDGLADPSGYLRALAAGAARALGGSGDAGEPAVWTVVEKILGHGEKLPPGWAVSGTTGYEAARLFTGVLVAGRATPALDAFYRRFTGDARSFEEHARECKRMILRTTFASEVRALADALERIAAADRSWCDLTPSALTVALEETIAAFPVYRSYVRPDGAHDRADEALIRGAIARARRRSPERVGDALDFLDEVLLGAARGPASSSAARAHAVMRFQQLTGPATAKAIEDTAFYRYVRFLAANEVGGEPSAIHVEVEELHRANAERAEEWPASMTATSTHDTKRGEDARARLAAISEIPDAWRKAVSRWARRARGKVTRVAAREAGGAARGEDAPTRREQYLIFQSIFGAWPFDRDPRTDVEARTALSERMVAYVEKALREAKERTSWVRPDAEHEEACRRFVERLLADDVLVDDVGALAGELESAAIANALAQVVLRIASPGVPDLYQGSETWNTSLVDPDNRRPVDFERLAAELESLRARAAREGAAAIARELYASARDGRIKLWVTHRALAARRADAALYAEGGYQPLEGDREGGEEHCVAFARIGRRAEAPAAHVAVVSRLPYSLAGARPPIGEAFGARRVRGPALREGTEWRDALTDRTHRAGADGLALAEVLADLPCALLVRER